MRSAKLVRFADFLNEIITIGKQWKMDYFDTSEYSRDHFLYRARNKKVLWKMKDATHRVPVEKFVGLRPKMYSILFTKDNKPVEKKAAKAFPRTWPSQNFDISIISHTLIEKDHLGDRIPEKDCKSCLWETSADGANESNLKRKPSTLFSDLNQDRFFTPRW